MLGLWGMNVHVPGEGGTVSNNDFSTDSTVHSILCRVTLGSPLS